MNGLIQEKSCRGLQITNFKLYIYIYKYSPYVFDLSSTSNKVYNKLLTSGNMQLRHWSAQNPVFLSKQQYYSIAGKHSYEKQDKKTYKRLSDQNSGAMFQRMI